MMLLTKANRQALAPLGSGSELATVKFFGSGRWTWYASEFDGDDTFFGYVESGLGSDCDEFGYFSLSELTAMRFRPFGLPVERDRYWSPRTFQEIRMKGAR